MQVLITDSAVIYTMTDLVIVQSSNFLDYLDESREKTSCEVNHTSLV